MGTTERILLMPKGQHYGRTQTRAYTTEYHRVSAKVFKSLINAPLGDYELESEFVTREHKKLKLIELDNGLRLMTFIINSKRHQIALKLDNRSASNKLYITCPYCQKQRQHLYIIKTAYACRECLGLHYACQSQRPNDRLMRKIRKLRIELWGYDWPDVYNMFEKVIFWPKPKWMRWKTFNQKRDRIIELENQYWPMAVSQLRTTFGENFMPEFKN